MVYDRNGDLIWDLQDKLAPGLNLEARIPVRGQFHAAPIQSNLHLNFRLQMWLLMFARNPCRIRCAGRSRNAAEQKRTRAPSAGTTKRQLERFTTNEKRKVNTTQIVWLFDRPHKFSHCRSRSVWVCARERKKVKTRSSLKAWTATHRNSNTRHRIDDHPHAQVFSSVCCLSTQHKFISSTSKQASTTTTPTRRRRLGRREYLI